jgi:hypothetical protein
MATELAAASRAAWPNGVRLPVLLTFEHQSGEGTPQLPGDRPNAMMGGAMQYGGRRGIWNILEELERHDVAATFCVCGTTAEAYPDAVRAAHEAGHEIAGMSYAFERVRTASVEREHGIVRKSVLGDGRLAAKNPAMVKKFRAAMHTAITYLNAHPDVATTMVAEFTGMQADTLQHMTMVDWSDRVVRDNWEKTIQMMVRNGLIGPSLKFSDHVPAESP